LVRKKKGKNKVYFFVNS